VVDVYFGSGRINELSNLRPSVFICGASSGFSLRLCDSAVKIALFFGSWILVFGFWRTLFQRIRVFRPCIDLHEGKVKQIVGGTLSDSGAGLRTNFVSEKSAAWFADLYRRDALRGGHVILLGPGNEEAAREALAAYPGGLHLGGGVNLENARAWLEAGASHVIVTSWVFRDGRVDYERLNELVTRIGKSRLVLDLSCRQRDGEYFVVTDRWQKFTDEKLSPALLQKLGEHCDEFLFHAADVEGLCRGIDQALVTKLGEWTPLPTTYAGGARSLEDLEMVSRLGRGRIDLTIGSALDIFGGTGVTYEEAVAFNRRTSG
jgi:phosphoribosylformimino-5-aminoimidazole carboxamide ribotide isomerase